MQQENAERYINIIPLTHLDHRIILQGKKPPLQRMKISNNATLSTIAEYIHELASTLDQKQNTVSLHVPYNANCVQLPLQITVSDFLLITNQGNEGKIRYRFDKKVEAKNKPLTDSTPKVAPKINKKDANDQIPPIDNELMLPKKKRYQSKNQLNGISLAAPKIRNKTAESTPQPSIPHQRHQLPEFADSMNGIFHTGFHLFSNSFGNFPPNIDASFNSQNSNDNESKVPLSNEAISLKRDLEKILQK